MVRLIRFGLIFATLLIYVSGESSEKDDQKDHDSGDDHPEYIIPTPEDVFFYETFSTSLKKSSWVVSEHNQGKMKIGKGLQETRIKSEQGLILTEEAKRYAISSNFPANFDPADQDLVIQYEVRFHKTHECGGAYLKVLKSESGFKPETFKDGDEYVIMFGPDKCGSTNKVHFIFRHQHKITGKFEEKHLKVPPAIKNDLMTHLYTLVIRTDNTYEILIDLESVKKGKLLEDFEPPVNPPKEIDDPDDKKPDDWVDEATILDPKASKPDDWDEDAPKKIVDKSAKMPSGWNEDAPLKVPDPKSEQPEDWDEEEDGAWEAPLVDNPACSVGCGKWEAPIIDNPDYKGKWVHPTIPNPDYKEEWKPRQISNPNYFEDEEPHKLHPMAAVGFEIWTMQNEIEFDNVFVDKSLEAAMEFGKATWAKKHAVEKVVLDKSDTGSGLLDPLYQFMDYASNNPLMGVMWVSLGILLLVAMVWVTIILCQDCCSEKKEQTQEESQPEGSPADSENKSEEKETDSDDEGEPDQNTGNDEGNKKNEEGNKKKEEVLEQEEGVDKVKEKQELEAKKAKEKKKKAEEKKKKEEVAKKEEQAKEQRKQKLSKKKRSHRAD